ncbi:MAG TPA: acetoin utilization protein AcuC [Methylomirabilota bacterium]|jgi:acetoin utilization protein AcuC|nr:acetoin utilization protein AcuC [Methylomirabilota bacterium]
MTTALIHSEDWRRFDYGPQHPLRMERLGLTWRLMEAYGLTRLPGMVVRAPRPAEEREITIYHTPEYVEVLRAANAGAIPPRGAAYGLGPGDNPVFRGLWEAAQLVAAGSLLAADLVIAGEVDRAFHFAGGLHHAMPDRASGFCYVNDAVLAILRLRAHGLRVAYVDIDAHHGDGVQHAFYGDREVLTISLHERGERLFPGTGFVNEVGSGDAAGFSVNVPLEAYTDAAIYLPAFEAVVPPLLERFRPDVLVAQLGIDSHRTDPLTHLALDVQGFGRALARMLPLAPKVIALGGGGYDLRNVARAWTVAWAVLNGVELPATLPEAFTPDAQRYGFGDLELWDVPQEISPDLRAAVSEYAARQVDAVHRAIFPFHGL